MNARKSICLLCHDLQSNALSRAYVLAKILECDYRVRIVGHSNGDIWEPVRHDSSIEYRPFAVRSAWDLWRQSGQLAKRLVDGDLIFAVKPINASFGLGLTARRILGKPLALDIDDWELGFISESVYWEARILKSKWLSEPNSPLYTRLLDRRIREADGVTVSNSFLQQRYGGLWIGQARDERSFDPHRFDAIERTDCTVLFLGSVRQHKGVDLLLDAWRHVRTPHARLRIVGTPLDDPQVQRLRPLADDRVSFEGPIPFERVPEVIAQADVFALPQLDGRASIGQVPMKMIDAMALGRAVIGTDVGDIPQWLANGSGVVIPPHHAAGMAEVIERLLGDSSERERLGMRARNRFLEYGSFASVRARLIPWIADLIAGRKPLATELAFAECYRHEARPIEAVRVSCEEAVA